MNDQFDEDLNEDKELLATKVECLMVERAEPKQIPHDDDDDDHGINNDHDDDNGNDDDNDNRDEDNDDNEDGSGNDDDNDNDDYDACNLYYLPLAETLLPNEEAFNRKELHGTVLHKLVGLVWKGLPEDLPLYFSERCKEILSKVVKDNPALLDITDFHGRNPLQCFIIGITEHKDLVRIVNDIVPTLKSKNNVNAQDKNGETVLHILEERYTQTGYEAFLEIVKCLRSSSNVNIQDRDGETVLHRIVERYRLVSCEEFLELVYCFRSSSNVNIQDKLGKTALHKLAEEVCCEPDCARSLLEVFPLLMTEKNVNMFDQNSVSPYSWIMAGIKKHKNHQEIFSQITEMFLAKGADSARGGDALPFLGHLTILLNMGLQDDLDEREGETLELLSEFGWNVSSQPDLFLAMVRKAHWIGRLPPFYVSSIQDMVERFEAFSWKLQDGPLQCLVEQMEDKNYKRDLFEHQEELLELIKVLTSADDTLHSRTKCLRTLIMNNEYLQPPSNPSIAWTGPLFYILNFLLEKGADPSWIPEDLADPSGNTSSSALYNFFMTLPPYSMSKDFFDHSSFMLLMGIMPHLHCDRYIKNKEWQETVLTFFNWKRLYDHQNYPPIQCFVKYKLVIDKVVEYYPALVDVTDIRGKTALHDFILCINSPAGVLEEVSDLICEIALFLRSETNTVIQDGQGKTPLHYLAEASPVFLHSDSRKCQEVFLVLAECVACPSNTNLQDEHGLTPLHILTENYLKNIPDQSREIWDEILQNFTSDFSLDIADKQGQTVLHYLAKNYATFLLSEESHQLFLALARRYASPSNKDMQDKRGCTPLHILAQKCNIKCFSHESQKTLYDVFSCLTSASNINIPDKTGFTVVHILVKNIFWNEKLGPNLLDIFPFITTSQNVNMTSRHSVTPFSWIRREKWESDRDDSETPKVFSNIKEIFSQNGADATLASQGVAFINLLDRLKELTEKVHTAKDLDIHGQEILDLFSEGGQSTMDYLPDYLPNVFMRFVREMRHLLGSTYYIHIVQKMAEIYQVGISRPQEGPFQCLVEPMEKNNFMRALCEHHFGYNLLSLIQILQKASDSSQTRTRCLRVLLLNTQYRPWGQGTLLWSQKLLDTIGLLLQTGADPTWIPQGGYEGSALFNFLQRIPLILARDAHIHDALLSFLPRLLTDEYLKHREPRGTVLHALVGYNWCYLPEDLPRDFYEQYKRIICTVVEANPALLDIIDSHGRNPVQCLIRGITEHKDMVRIVNDIVPTLKTENYFNDQDESGQTVLHILEGRHTQIGLAAFLELIKYFRTSSNVDIQDKHGQTVLHILTEKYLQTSHEAFLELAGCVRSSANVDIQDEDGQTVLHILAKKYVQTGHEALLELIKCFRSSYNVDIQDQHGRTVLHILAEKYLQIGIEEFLELITCLRSSVNVDIQDKQGQTVLLIVARATALQHQELGSGLLAIFPLLATEKNVHLFDNHSVYPYYWILVTMARWGNEERDEKISSEIEKIFLRTGAYADFKKDPALRRSLYRWAGRDLSDVGCTTYRLQLLLNGLKTLPAENTLCYMKEFAEKVWGNLSSIRNAKCISTMMDIMTILMADESTAQHAWTSITSYRPDQKLDKKQSDISLSIDILRLSLKRGAKSIGWRMEELLRETNKVEWNTEPIVHDITRHEEMTVAVFKTLVALSKTNNVSCDLQFLCDFYIVSEEMLQLGRQLVLQVHGTMASCLESQDLLVIFLFISNIQEETEEIPIDAFLRENWLRRSPLHLAAIILDNEKAWNYLPKTMIETYLNEGDLHGCTPLHLAYLHRNEQAIQYLKAHGAEKNVTDKFGMSPESLVRTTEDLHDVRHKELCRRVLEVESGVLEQMKPMLVHSEDEAKTLSDEVKALMERLIRGTPYEKAIVQMGGSMRERLKAGCLDEADIQLKFEGEKVTTYEFTFKGIRWDEQVLMKELSQCLRKRLAEISWEGINLRPISVHGPWQFLKEGVTVSLDVVPLIASDRRLPDVDAHGLQEEILVGKHPLHNHTKYCIVETWSDKGIHPFTETYFEYEWDVMDSLPVSCRLAIVIGKALVQAYDLCRGDSQRVKIPISSYMIKTALFYILAHNSGQLELRGFRGRALRNALSRVEGGKSEVPTGPSKFKYNPQPKWATDEDVDQHGEEARVWTWKIFTLLKCLTQERDGSAAQGWKLNSYWNRELPVIPFSDDYGEADYICDICDCALERLNPNTFHNNNP